MVSGTHRDEQKKLTRAAILMNMNETKKIFLKALPGLTEPLKSAVEFILADWHEPSREQIKVDNLPQEIWRDVVGYEGLYQVSTMGRVKIVARAFIPNPEGKPVIHHRNKKRADNRVDNLKWVTYAENSAYAVQDGSYDKKDSCATPRAKLKAETLHSRTLHFSSSRVRRKCFGKKIQCVHKHHLQRG